MRNRRRAHVLAIATVASAALVGTLGTAFGGSTVYGAKTGYTVDGIAYENQSAGAVTTGPSGITTLVTANNQKVAAGWMGVLPRLYESNGNLCKQPSAWSYNDEVEAGVGNLIAWSCGSGAYFGWGVSESWNGSGYTEVNTARSPNFNYSAAAVIQSTNSVSEATVHGTYPWKRNAAGQSFGSAADAPTLADEPDLIMVVASNGKSGYAYRDQLTPQSAANPAAAVAEQRARQAAGAHAAKAIPVYAEDGVTVIGEFEFSN